MVGVGGGRPFEFATATRVIFGAGTLARVPKEVVGWGRRWLVVTGRSRERARRLTAALEETGIEVCGFAVGGEPTVEEVEAGRQLAGERGIEAVLAFGGGSAIDAGKAIAALVSNPGPVTEYLEVIGPGRALFQPPLPFVAIPTTAGTGTEVTRNAVLTSREHSVKVSLRSSWLLPRLAVVDPELTYALPPAITAATGLDALTQLIEPFVSCRATPLTDALCREGMMRVARSLRPAFAAAARAEPAGGGQTEWTGAERAAREDMAVASLFSGMALANAGLGAVHGLAGPIGGECHAPHGAICAALLPRVFEVNVAALRQRAPSSEGLRRFDEVGRVLTGEAKAGADQAVSWLMDLVRDLGIPALGALGLTREQIPGLVEKAARASSMKANPIPLTPEGLISVLERAW